MKNKSSFLFVEQYLFLENIVKSINLNYQKQFPIQQQYIFTYFPFKMHDLTLGN